jgi:hypothetical protein
MRLTAQKMQKIGQICGQTGYHASSHAQNEYFRSGALMARRDISKTIALEADTLSLE